MYRLLLLLAVLVWQGVFSPSAWAQHKTMVADAMTFCQPRPQLARSSFRACDEFYQRNAKSDQPRMNHRMHRFGQSVSISGDRALIGAHLYEEDNLFSGAAYIFDFDGTTWNQSALLIANDASSFDEFGFSVSLDGDRALVSARLDDDKGSNAGSAVYIFDFDGTNWNQTQKLTANDGAPGDDFGYSVSLKGNRALVGAEANDDNGNASGSAYVFDFDGAIWSQTQKLTASDGQLGDQFGFSVSLSGDRALIGVFADDDLGVDAGSAYIFDFDGANWNETQKLTASDGDESDTFGWSVSLDGSRALISARRDGENGVNGGAAYVFDFDGTNWNESEKLTASDGEAGYIFGYSVSLEKDRALIGVTSDDDQR